MFLLDILLVTFLLRTVRKCKLNSCGLKAAKCRWYARRVVRSKKSLKRNASERETKFKKGINGTLQAKKMKKK